MVRNKEVVAWTIDIRIINKINSQALEEGRSRSYIANKYLQEVLNETI